MMPDKKGPPALALVVHAGGAAKHLGEPPGEPDGDEPDADSGKSDAADALIEAVHAKDVEGVKQALEAFCDSHMGDDKQ